MHAPTVLHLSCTTPAAPNDYRGLQNGPDNLSPVESSINPPLTRARHPPDLQSLSALGDSVGRTYNETLYKSLVNPYGSGNVGGLSVLNVAFEQFAVIVPIVLFECFAWNSRPSVREG